MSIRPSLVRGLALLGCALASGCMANASPEENRARIAEGDGDIVIAAPWPWEARSQLLYAEGLELAVEEVNASGGIGGRALRLLKSDDGQSVNQGRLVAQQLAEDPEVMAVVGHLQSYVTVPAAAIYDLAGLVLVAPTSTSEELTARDYPRVFRTTLTDRAIGQQMAEYALDEGYRRIAIFYVRNEYGRALANAFEERIQRVEAEVVARHSYDALQDVSARTLDPVLTAWEDLDPEAVFLAGEAPLAGHIIAAIRRAGLDMPILGPDAMSNPGLISAGGSAVEGTVVASLFHPDEPDPEVGDFVQRFHAAYGEAPDLAAAVGYDAIRVLAQAMRSAGTPSPIEVAEALRYLDWQGVTGHFRFDERGELVEREIVRLVVRDGEFAYLPRDEAGERPLAAP